MSINYTQVQNVELEMVANRTALGIRGQLNLVSYWPSLFTIFKHKQHASVPACAISYFHKQLYGGAKTKHDNKKASAAVQRVTAPKLLLTPPTIFSMKKT